jgi:hypothetical protein
MGETNFYTILVEKSQDERQGGDLSVDGRAM